MIKKLVVFDFDSTLMDGESIDNLALLHGVENEIKEITKNTMEGGLDFYSSLKKRVALLRGLEVEKARIAIKGFPLMPGAIECVRVLREAGCIVVCFSGGFRIVTEYFKDILWLNAAFSNTLHTQYFDSALRFSGEVGGEMMFNNSKGVMLKNLQGMLDFTNDECVAIGDGANDLSSFEFASTKIAFCAKDILKKEATHIVNKKDLREVIEIIK